ncbi:MAG: phosphatidylglycerophosphatase A family protein [Gemmatimonadota bacterium]
MTGARWIATLGPVGYWPWGPGTFASALVGIVWWTVPVPGWAWLALLVLVTAVGIASAGRAEESLGPDDGRIIIDEVTGMGLAAVVVPHTLAGTGLAFVLFRVFDILKPPPVGRMQDLPRGWGVMADDVAAGALAALVGGIFAALWL